jgi:hypothetical protein
MILPLSACARRVSAILKRLGAGKSVSAADQAFAEILIEANSPRDPGRPRNEITKLPQYATLQECSGATGIPLPILKAAKKAGCFAGKHGRVDLAAFLRWAFSGDSVSEDGIDWGNELRKWLAKRARLVHDREARLTIAVSEANDGIKAGVAFLKDEHYRIFTIELPAVLKGQNEIAIRERNLKELDQIWDVRAAEYFRGLIPA